MIKVVSGAAITPDWEVVSEIDFTTVPGTYTFTEGSSTGSATPELGNVDWTCRNLATYGGGAAHVKFINGTGFQIYIPTTGHTTTTDNWYAKLMQGLLISADVSDLVPDFDDSDTLCFQTILTSSFTGGSAANYISNGFLITDGGYGAPPAGTATGNWYGMQYYQTTQAGATGVMYNRYGGFTGESPNPADYTSGFAGAATYYELISTPGATWIASGAITGSAGVAVTSFPTPLTTFGLFGKSVGNEQATKGYAITNMPGGAPDGLTSPPQWDLRPDNMKICLTSRIYAPGNSLNFTTTFTKLRVLRRPRHDL